MSKCRVMESENRMRTKESGGGNRKDCGRETKSKERWSDRGEKKNGEGGLGAEDDDPS